MPGGGVVHAPLSWIAEFAELPPGLGAQELADALVRAGLEVERIDSPAQSLSGPIVIGRIVSFTPEAQKNGKTIRWCQVDVGSVEVDAADVGAAPFGSDPAEDGPTRPRGIVCGADNFAVGDLVVVALPGAVLPGGFAISARKTYGHVSDGMICSGRELGISDDHLGILVLAPAAAVAGADALAALGLREAVLEIAVTPDRGYCLSMRGLAREVATALGVAYRDIAATATTAAAAAAAGRAAADPSGYPVLVEDPIGCDQFSCRILTGVDPSVPSPPWLAQRLRSAGLRSISLIVDVTNYVMLETGQPLHAFDRDTLRGPIVVRRAHAGEKLITLDGVSRSLHPEDLVVGDDSGPIALAGVMGGASTEITSTTTEVVLEAAHWDPSTIARTVRRHRLPSEAAKRFERGVDPAVAVVALARCVELLIEAGAVAGSAADQRETGYTVVGPGPSPITIALRADQAGATAGMTISPATVGQRLRQVGCRVDDAAGNFDSGPGLILDVCPPTWRPDLLTPADLVEEIIRLEGYEKVPSALPTPPPGRGLTEPQILRRSVSRALAAAGYTEVLSYPFVASSIHDDFGLSAQDPRRQSARLVNPLSEAEPELRTSLLPGLLASLTRNLGRGNRDFGLYEMGLVYLPRADAPPVPRPGVAHRPDDAELRALDAAIPRQPRHVGVVLAGDVDRAGWWGAGRRANWADAIAAAHVVADAARTVLTVTAADHPPWHPGRCAQLRLDGVVVGYAGELHPRAIAALELPERTAAMEIDLDAFAAPAPVAAASISAFPPVLIDLALVLDADVASSAVLAAVTEGAGELLESIRLFDCYADDQRLGVGLKSLAFALRLRAPDRTLTSEHAVAIRDSALARAAELFGARLRS